MKTLTTLLITSLLCALIGMGAVGCNMFRGAGKDIQKGGRAVERAAENIQSGQKHPSTIMAWADAHGSIDPAGNTSTPHQTDRTFTITPHHGYEVSDVLVDGASVGAVKSHTFEGVTSNHTIRALFTISANQ